MKKAESFAQAFTEAKAELFQRAVTALHSHALTFVKTLVDVCIDPKARGSEQATAARSGLDSLIKAIEIFDFSDRILKLERAAGDRDQ
jgi:hypothetical protein